LRVAPAVLSVTHGEGRRPGGGQAAADRRGEGQAPREALQDGARPRGRRLHRRRLRNRRPARARPALGQPDRQPVRRLRRHQPRRLRGLDGGQRHHPRGDDARRQSPGADALPRHRRRHAAAAQRRRVRPLGRDAALQAGARRPRARGQLGSISAMDVVLHLAEALPSGMYSGSGIEDYVRTVLSDPDRTDDFRLLDNELYRAATDLDTCERIVFGANDWDDVPISTAVRASTALPMVYKPVRVRARELIDGGIVSTTTLDIAVEAGAKFIVVVNPLVPYVNDFTEPVSGLFGSRPRHVSDMGLPQIGYQAFKLMAYQRLHEMAKKWEDRYPGVDIVLIEPEPNDELMFQTSIMNFTKRVDIARHGFQSVTLKLASDYDNFRTVC